MITPSRSVFAARFQSQFHRHCLDDDVALREERERLVRAHRSSTGVREVSVLAA
jgi:hypothetical protein